MSSGNGQAGRPAGMPGAEAFIEEAGELLEQLEHGLLALEGCAPGSQAETVDEIFRALHTIKGSGAMFGFGALADMTHHFEDAFDRVRGGTLSVDRHLIDLSLAARDKMVGLLEVGPGDAAPTHLAVAIDELIAAVQDHMDAGGGEGVVAEAPTAAPTPAQTPADARHRYHIHFKPAASSLLGGMRPDLLVEELCCLGEAEASIDASAVPGLDHLDPTSCYLAWEIVLTTEESRKIVEGVFIFADDADLTIEEVRAAAAPPSTCTPDTPLHDQPRPVPLSSDASAAD
ncbi:MAG: Hpt domain-containing protein, partial [Pseudomonadota bacterium]